jgi:aspartate aminotransferase
MQRTPIVMDPAAVAAGSCLAGAATLWRHGMSTNDERVPASNGAGTPGLVAAQIDRVAGTIDGLVAFMLGSRWAQRLNEPGISDFVVGNPHELPLPGFVRALQHRAEPRNKDWFAYKMSEPAARQTVAANLRQRRDVPFEPDDVLMTNGAFAGLAVCLRAVVDPGDEVIYVTPPWFFYEALIVGCGATPVAVPANPETFDLDVAAIAAAVTPRTRAIVVNSPHNPTGRIYPRETLSRLGDVLTDASRRHGRPVFLLSDEAYHRILFDGRSFPSPTEHYPYSFAIYTYGKVLLTPGQRIGWIALPPTMPLADRERLRLALTVAQVTTGYAFPNALLQHAIEEIDGLSIDVDHLQQKRDRVVSALRSQGYHLLEPEGTFYVLVRSPEKNDLAYCERLAEQDVFVLPGTVAGAPGWFRISLTGNDEMIERAIPIFGAVLAETRGALAAAS